MEIENLLDQKKVYFDENLKIWRAKNIMDEESKKEWDEHYTKHNPDTLFQKFCSIYRRLFISNLVKKYADKFLPENGIIVEAGCGTGESSAKIPKRNRTFVAVDISAHPLINHRNPNVDIKLQADIFNLPFKDNSVDAIFNLGVHEHFTWEENIRILNEYRRILKPNGVLLLFWPWKYCWVELVSKIKPLFPRSPMMFGDFDEHKLFNMAGYDLVINELSPLDIFIHKVIVCRVKKK